MKTEPLARLVGQLRRTLDASDLITLSDAELLAHFIESRDPATFEAIVLRHGPRVLGVCRRVLRNEPDAEDAFQATFVVLMRDARSIRNRSALGHWLFGVAHRIALQARSSRRRRERIESGLTPNCESSADITWREATAILHEELERLPETNRGPLMLCYLEGLSRDEAANQLGRTPGSVKKGLERGREILRKRLTRRGVTLSAGLLAALSDSANASMSPGLVRATIECTSTPAPAVADLARATAGTRSLKFMWAGLAASVLAVGIALGMPSDQKPDSPTKEKSEAKAAEKRPDMWAYEGTVTGPDGKPVKGAKLWLFLDGTTKLRDVGESDAEGQFSFQIRRSEFTTRSYYGNGRDLWSVGTVLAVTPGNAIGYGHGSVVPGERIPIELSKDDAPIEGRVQNLEGQGVAGATVRVIGLYRPKRADLEAWYGGVKAGKLNQQVIYDHLGAFEGDDLIDGVLNPLYPPVSTGKDGKFTLKGLGRERVALLRIEGDGIETEDVMVMTRQGKEVIAARDVEIKSGAPQILNGRYTVYGAKFNHSAAPSSPIAGVVRDLDTGKPVANAMVTLAAAGSDGLARKPERLWARTGADGKYRLTGVRVQRGCTLSVEGPADQPYLASMIEVPIVAGLAPITLDLKVKRGIWATVRVFDKADNSSQPCEVEYFAIADNPNLKNVPTLRPTQVRRANINDDTIRLAVLPGPGIVAVQIPGRHSFVSLSSPRAKSIAAAPFSFQPQRYLGHMRIDPAADAKDAKVEIGLTRGTE
jgi:RNA polymerase sigma factor (sigma-70 family)